MLAFSFGSEHLRRSIVHCMSLFLFSGDTSASFFSSGCAQVLDRPNGMNRWALFMDLQLGLHWFHISFMFILMFLSFFCISSGSLPSLLKFEIFVLAGMESCWTSWVRCLVLIFIERTTTPWSSALLRYWDLCQGFFQTGSSEHSIPPWHVYTTLASDQ